MSQRKFIDFSFRYRPDVDSPDGILCRYLQSYPPVERRHLILKALRAFYLVAAYGGLANFEQISDVKELVLMLEKTYGDGADGPINHTLSLNITVDYMGFSNFSGGDSLGEDD